MSLPEESQTGLVALVDLYIETLQHRGLALNSQVIHRRALGCLTQHLTRQGVLDIIQVQEIHLTRWIAYLKEEVRPRIATRGLRSHYSASTIRQRISAVRAFFGWLQQNGTLLLDPARDLSTAGFVDDPVARLKIPTEAEMRVLLADLPKDSLIQIRDWAILELIYSSALRIGEVRMLDVYDLDIESGVVHIRQAKGRKDRRVPLGRVAGRILHYWLDTIRPQLVEDGLSTALFVTLQGRRMQMGTLHARLRCLRERHGLPMGRFHSYRHASALHLLRGGADLRHVQELLGHSHVISTQIYTRLAPADLKEAHRKTHPRERHKGLKG